MARPVDILIDEWDEALGEQAARWGADNGGKVDSNGARWTAPLGGVSVTVDLQLVGRTHMRAAVSVGSSGNMQHDPYHHARVLRDALDTIDKATAAHLALAHHRVWVADCPCWCGERNRAEHEPCGGTGLRQPPPEVK